MVLNRLLKNRNWIKCGFLGLLFSSGLLGNAQNITSPFYLKYLFTENDYFKNFNLDGSRITGNANKQFLSTHLINANILSSTSVNPAEFYGIESSGQTYSYYLNWPEYKKKEFSYVRAASMNQAYAAIKVPIKYKNGKLPNFNWQGFAAFQNQDNSRFQGTLDNLNLNAQSINAGLTLNNMHYSLKQNFRAKLHYVGGNTSGTYNINNALSWQQRNIKGDFLVADFDYTRRWSRNHTLKAGINSQLYRQTSQFARSYFVHTNQSNFWLNDVLYRKKNNYEVGVRLTQNSAKTDVFGDTSVNYFVGHFYTTYKHWFKEDKTMFEFSQQLGYHSEEKVFWNPFLLFSNKVKDDLTVQLGAMQQKRTPGLLFEFQSFFNQIRPNQLVSGTYITTMQETYKQAFVNSSYKVTHYQTLEIKYIYNELPDKWLLKAKSNMLERGLMKYSTLLVKHQWYRVRINGWLLYQTNIAETYNAEMLPKHLVHGYFETRGDQKHIWRNIPFFDHFRYFTPKLKIETAYLSKYYMPMLQNQKMIEQSGGLFLDLLAELNFRNEYYYKENYNVKNITLQFGITNALNEGQSKTYAETSLYRPIAPKRMLVGVSVSF